MSAIGRFASADTIIPNPGNPQSYNRYGYVQNNPLRFIDPTGHKETECDNPDDCNLNSDIIENIQSEYEEGDYIIFGIGDEIPIEDYIEFAIWMFHFQSAGRTWADQTLTFEFEGSFCLLACLGLNLPINLLGERASGNFGVALDIVLELEYGIGLGGELDGIGIEGKQIAGLATGDGYYEEYAAQFFQFAMSRGISIDTTESWLIIRPTGLLSREMANGDSAAWETFWQAAGGIVPEGYQYLGTNSPHSDLMTHMGEHVPIHPITYSMNQLLSRPDCQTLFGEYAACY